MNTVRHVIFWIFLLIFGFVLGFNGGRSYQIGYYEEIQRLRYLTEEMAFFSLSQDLTRIQQTIDQNLINEQYDVNMSDESVR